VFVRSRWFIAGALVLVGLVWIAQGLGFLRGSGFMDGDVRWAIIGAAMVAPVLAVAVWTLIRRRRA
jgi:hypothetical protein